MRYWMIRGGLSGLLVLAVAGIGLMLLSYSQAEQHTPDASSDLAARDLDVETLESPLAAVYFGREAIRSNIELAGPLVGVGTDRKWACSSCHGALGQGTENVPRLAGLPAGYLTKQLHDYASKRRLNDNMQYIAEELTDKEMAALGQFYAELDAPSNARPALSGDLVRGRELALQGDWNLDVPACYSCHGSSAWGVGQSFPALAGQHPSYLYAQLASWKEGRRANSPVGLMHSVALALSDTDMRSVADYLSTLPAPPGQRKLQLDTPAPDRLTTSKHADSQGGSDNHE